MDEVERLNKLLVEHYGADLSGQPQFRIVWADDQIEKRMTDFTDTGVRLLCPEIREVKKYTYLEGVYILERLVLIDEAELPGVMMSYEPVWVYKSADGFPLPPLWEPTKVVIDILYAALGKSNLAKYVEDDSPEKRFAEIDKIAEELFGNENETTDALAYKEGIVVPRNYEKD